MWGWAIMEETNELGKERCLACAKDALPLSRAEIAGLQPQIPQWQVVMDGEIPKLERVFRFRNFAEALAFTIKVGELAIVLPERP